MKSIIKSKVFWVAVIQAVIGVWAVFETQLPGVGWVLVGKSILDVVLRFATALPVGIKVK